MNVPEHIDAIDREATRLAAAASRTDPDATVPTCPDWTLRDLVRHVGGVHRWAARNVSHPSPDPVPADDEQRLMQSWPDDDGALLYWFREGHGALLSTLRAAPPDLACWSFLPAPSPLAFWARRQAHETAIHRADAEAAGAGGVTAITPVPPALGADGLDELLLRFAVRRVKPVAAVTRTLSLRASDAQREWTVRLGPEGVGAVPEASDAADCSVRGDASDLYLLMWNRRGVDGLGVRGDSTVLQLWGETVRVRWS